MARQTRNKSKIKGGWLFLGAVLLLYGAVTLTDVSLAAQSLHFFGQVVRQVVPVLALVFVLMVLFNYILTPERIRHYVGEASGLKGWLLAMVSGILATGPIYGWYMLMGDLKRQGMKSSLVAVFLYSRAVKLPLLPLMVHYFGVQYTIILSVYLICFSLVNGLIVGALAGDSHTSDL